jgi:hypothetical protein
MLQAIWNTDIISNSHNHYENQYQEFVDTIIGICAFVWKSDLFNQAFNQMSFNDLMFKKDIR